MNYTIAKPNAKGQLVIPSKMRKNWGISTDTHVHIIDAPNIGIIIKPASLKNEMTDEEYLQILEETQGTWIDDDWDQTEQKLDILAKQELKDLHKNSW